MQPELALEPRMKTAQDLYNFIYKACDHLRGPVGHESFKDYLTPLLYFKRLSDTWDEEYASALEESGGDEEYARLPEQHSFVIPEGCHWEDIRQRDENIVNDIDDQVVRIIRTFNDAFSTVAGKREVRQLLRSILWVRYQIKDNDVFEKAYGYVEQYY